VHAGDGHAVQNSVGQVFLKTVTRVGKPPKLIIGAIMRKLVHVTFGVLKSGKSFDTALHGA
jgi:transposase